MREDRGRQRCGAQKDKGGVEAEDGGVAELDEGAEQGREEGSVRMCEPVFVEVVDVGDAKVQRRQEDDPSGREAGQEMQRHEGGAKDDFFGYGALFFDNAKNC